MTEDSTDALPEWMDLTAQIMDEPAAAAVAAANEDSMPEDAPASQGPQQDFTATDDVRKPTGRRAVMHNQHDVDALEQECNRLHVAIAERGAQLDVLALTARAQAFTAIKLLVDRGICTEAEAEAQAFTAIKLLVDRGICTEAEAQAALLEQIRNMLAGILQQVEVTRLQQQRQQAGAVQAVRQPDLILPASATRPPPRRQQD